LIFPIIQPAAVQHQPKGVQTMTFLKSNRKFAIKRSALCVLALLAVGQVGAKTLVYCSEGSP